MDVMERVATQAITKHQADTLGFAPIVWIIIRKTGFFGGFYFSLRLSRVPSMLRK